MVWPRPGGSCGWSGMCEAEAVVRGVSVQFPMESGCSRRPRPQPFPNSTNLQKAEIDPSCQITEAAEETSRKEGVTRKVGEAADRRGSGESWERRGKGLGAGSGVSDLLPGEKRGEVEARAEASPCVPPRGQVNGAGWGVESWGREEEGGRCVTPGRAVPEGLPAGRPRSTAPASGARWPSAGAAARPGRR